MGSQTQTRDLENRNEEPSVDEIAEEHSVKPESDELPEVMKKRIVRVKKAFRPTWLIKQIDSQDDNKEK